MDESKYKQFLNCGAMYISGRAKKGKQPIIHINLDKLIKVKADSNEMQQTNLFLFDWIVREMLVPGRVEQWMVILDFDDVGVTQIPVKQMKVLIDTIKHRFQGRLYRMIAINSNWLMRAFWKIVWNWIDEYMQ